MKKKQQSKKPPPEFAGYQYDAGMWFEGPSQHWTDARYILDYTVVTNMWNLAIYAGPRGGTYVGTLEAKTPAKLKVKLVTYLLTGDLGDTHEEA